MKCCGCKKEINIKDTSRKDGVVQWFGRFRGDKCIQVICRECMDNPEKRKIYLGV